MIRKPKYDTSLKKEQVEYSAFFPVDKKPAFWAEDFAKGYSLRVYKGRFLMQGEYKQNKDRISKCYVVYLRNGSPAFCMGYILDRDRLIYISEADFDRNWLNIRSSIAHGIEYGMMFGNPPIKEPEEAVDLSLLNDRHKVAMLKNEEIEYIGMKEFHQEEADKTAESEEEEKPDQGCPEPESGRDKPSEYSNSGRDEGESFWSAEDQANFLREQEKEGNRFFVENDKGIVHDAGCSTLKNLCLKVKGFKHKPAGTVYCKRCGKLLMIKSLCDFEQKASGQLICKFPMFSEELLQGLCDEDHVKIKRIYQGNSNNLEVRKGEDVFRILYRQNEPYKIQHGNYRILNDGKRISAPGFHDQKSSYLKGKSLDLGNIFEYIHWYSYDKGHVDDKDEFAETGLSDTADEIHEPEETAEAAEEYALQPLTEPGDGIYNPSGDSMPNLDRLLAINKILEIWRVGNDTYGVCFKNARIKGTSHLPRTAGQGRTLDEACASYMKALQGQTLTFKLPYKNPEEVTIL